MSRVAATPTPSVRFSSRAFRCASVVTSMYGILLVTAVAVCVLSRGAIAEPVVTFQGVGPVRIGMTAVAAEQALGAPIRKLDSISGDDGKSCWIGSRADGVDPELTYLFERGKLTRI